MTFNILTLFPDFFHSALTHGVLGQSINSGKVNINCVNPRDFALDVHRTVDDRPFGGGDGMVMKVEPLIAALDSLKGQKGVVVALTPQGEKWSDQMARGMAQSKAPVTLICGRYAGIDERFVKHYVQQEISIGDYVLSGGEYAALVVLDSVARFCPGVLGNPLSPNDETFSDGLLECPLFTRPQHHEAGAVPSFLLSGDHAKIQTLRKAVSLLRTYKRRSDLLPLANVTDLDIRKAKKNLVGLPVADLAVLGFESNDLDL